MNYIKFSMKKIAILSILILSFFAVSFAFAAQQPEMNVYVADINVGETAHVQVILPIDVIGEVIVSVNDQNYTAKVVNGNATVDLKDLKEGNYTLNVTCPENGNYSKISKNVSLSVINKTPSVPDNKTPDNKTPENKTPVSPENKTPVNPKNNTPANAGGEPVNTQNVTPVAPTNITNDTNTTNKTNNTNNTVPTKKVDNPPAQTEKPKTEQPKYYLILQKAGLPIAILVLVVIVVIVGGIYLRKK